jgi:ParB/RepB/Spo0J family partition protein
MELQQIPLGAIKAPEILNIRLDYGEIQELALSILNTGLQQPLTVQANESEPGTFTVLDGFRRMRALKSLGTDAPEMVPCLIREMNPVESLYLQCTGNAGKNLLPMELAELCRRLEEAGEPLELIAKKTGKSKGYIDSIINLAYAPENIKDAVKSNVISGTEAMRIMREVNSDDLEAVLSEAQAIANDTGKPAKVTKSKSNTGNAGEMLMALYQETGNSQISVIMEYINGSIDLSEAVSILNDQSNQ